jgi:hypothetical protein
VSAIVLGAAVLGAVGAYVAYQQIGRPARRAALADGLGATEAASARVDGGRGER